MLCTFTIRTIPSLFGLFHHLCCCMLHVWLLLLLHACYCWTFNVNCCCMLHVACVLLLHVACVILPLLHGWYCCCCICVTAAYCMCDCIAAVCILLLDVAYKLLLLLHGCYCCMLHGCYCCMLHACYYLLHAACIYCYMHDTAAVTCLIHLASLLPLGIFSYDKKFLIAIQKSPQMPHTPSIAPHTVTLLHILQFTVHYGIKSLSAQVAPRWSALLFSFGL